MEATPGILILRFDGPLFFANVGYFREQLAAALDRREEPVTTVILNAEGISSMDSTATDALRDLLEELSDKKIKLIMAGVIGPVRDTLFLSGFTDDLGPEFFAFDVADAVALINRPLHPRPRPDYATQCSQQKNDGV